MNETFNRAGTAREFLNSIASRSHEKNVKQITAIIQCTMVLPVSSSSSSFKRPRLSQSFSEVLSHSHPSLVTTLGTSVLLNLILLSAVLLLGASHTNNTTHNTNESGLWTMSATINKNNSTTPHSCPQSTPMHWNGGHPLASLSGSCYCNAQPYCLCTPSLAIDVIIAQGDTVWCVRRKDTNQWAMMGGFVQVGELIEDTVRRELKEETGLELPPQSSDSSSSLQLFGVYADPRRDNRRHSAGVVYIVQYPANLPIHPVAADDVKQVQQLNLDNLHQYDFFADHATILHDYRDWYYEKNHHQQQSKRPKSVKGEPAVERSLCFHKKSNIHNT